MTTPRARATALLLLAVIIAGCKKSADRVASVAPTSSTHAPRSELSSVTAFVDSIGRGWSEARAFSGFMRVTRGGQVLYERGFGYADRSSGARNTAQTSFRIGSVTKQFTAAAILKLEEAGKLSTDDPISKHIPEYPKVGAGITIHQLLTHTTGIPSYTQLPQAMEGESRPHTVREMLALFWDKPLAFAPGTRFEYSNSNYVVLGAVIERAAGQPYADYLREQLFAPAGMKRTMVGDAEHLTDRALGYTIGEDHKLVAADPIDMSFPYAAGAVRSTAEDLTLWDQALAGERILSPRSKAKLYKPEKDQYAYGWEVREYKGHTLYEHDGGIHGFLTSYIRVPDLSLVIVAWSNNDGVSAGPVARAALAAALGQPIEPLGQPSPIPFDPVVARRCIGKYMLTTGSRKALIDAKLPKDVVESVEWVEVMVEKDQIVAKLKGQAAFALDQIGPASYFSPDAGIRIDFDIDAGTETASGLRILQGKLTIEFRRAR